MYKNIVEIAKEYPHINVTLTAEQLIEAIDYCVDRTRREITSEKEERYLTQKQVEEMFNISNTTIWRMEKKNILTPIFIGGQKRYPLSSINLMLKSNV
jgi:predicted DNA-binding transcriptional regulator AlpA